MISTSRFMLLWVGITVPVGLAQGLILQAATRDSAPQRMGAISLVLSAGGTLVVAVLQSLVLRRHRRPVRGWIWAALAGFVAATLVQFSLSMQMFRSSVGGNLVDRRGMLYGFLALQMLSMLLVRAAFEAVALWGLRWPVQAKLWLAGRGLIGLLLWAVAVAIHGAVTGLPRDLLNAALIAATAASTAWLLDRLAFRESSA